MTCDAGRLRAYLDHALTPDEWADVTEHLATCAGCRKTLTRLEHRANQVVGWLASLDPQPHEMSDARQALARFRTRTPAALSSTRTSVKARFEMTRQTLLTGRWRPAAIGVVALALMLTLFSFAPVRHAAAQFLGIFRVRRFAVIPIDPAQAERLEGLADLVDAGMLGEPTMLREPGDPQPVADAAEASSLAGFQVRVPSALPEGAALQQFHVQIGPAARFEVDREMMQALLDAAGVQGVTLPPIEVATADVDIQMAVIQTYRVGPGELTIFQLPSPTVTLPPGLDPTVLGEAMLQVLGLPPEEARRLAQSIDWTSTLLIPLPTDAATYREVEVDGVIGLMMEERPNRTHYRLGGMVLWERDGIVYAVGGDVDPTELLRVADSLQ